MLRVPPGHNDISSKELRDAIDAAKNRAALESSRELQKAKVRVQDVLVRAAELGKKSAIIYIGDVMPSTEKRLLEWIYAAGLTYRFDGPDKLHGPSYKVSWL